ncbi:uncharacterized protein LOC112027281 [Quercus suber]|uniref:Uncharacterized protein n=1 Tax=Quercus suber TaxID=58331 RepID=A0AAW0M476_QUESU|nr:nucleolin [Quercus suber]POF06430.1 hypothetical protein CFP56_63239 [Quercus suber]
MKKAQSEAKEVEELLQAAQDELLLKLSLDSHMSRVSPNYIDSDLDRRFQALKKSRPSSLSSSVVPQSQSHKSTDDNSNNSDLSARFAALKAKGSSSSSSSSAAVGVGVGPSSNILYEEEEDDEDDEVEKLIRWAKDAARLDPSPPSDDDDDQDDDDDEDEDYKKDCHEEPKGNHSRRK